MTFNFHDGEAIHMLSHNWGAWTVLQDLQPCFKAKTATGKRPRSPPSKAGIDAGQFVHKLFGIVIVLRLWCLKSR